MGTQNILNGNLVSDLIYSFNGHIILVNLLFVPFYPVDMWQNNFFGNFDFK